MCFEVYFTHLLVFTVDNRKAAVACEMNTTHGVLCVVFVDIAVNFIDPLQHVVPAVITLVEDVVFLC